MDDSNNFSLLPWNTSSFSVTSLARTQMNTFTECAKLQEKRRSREFWVFSHLTALLLLGVEIPRLLSTEVDPRPLDFGKIHVTVKRDSQRVRQGPVVTHLWQRSFSPLLVGSQLFVTPPVMTWAQMAPHVSLEELVVLGDSMMRNNPYLKRATFHEFEDFLVRTLNFPGRLKCVKAMKYMSENTDSSQETRLRFLLRQRGFPQPISNYRVVDAEYSQSFTLDLAWPNQRVGSEYDGHYHREEQQRKNDHFKRSRLAKMGWNIVPATVETLNDPHQRDAYLSDLLAAFARNS